MNLSKRFLLIALAAMAAVAVAEEQDNDNTATSIGRRLAQAQPAQGQPPPPATPQQRIAMLKEWLQASQAQLRTYEWVETTVITKDGEEKSRQQNTVYYGADGKLQKVPAATSGAETKSGGPPGVLPPGKLLKRAGEKKQEDLVEYMKKAATLMHSYVPPDGNRIQQAVNAGKFSVSPGQRVRLDFKDYLKAGDLLSIQIEGQTNRLLGMAVSSYLDTAEDEVQLNVGMGVLPDGTLYTSRTTLDAVAEGVVVTIQNTGHRQTGR